MPVKCQTIVTFIEEMAPRVLALEGDNTGWQVGHPQSPVEKAVLLTIDVDDQVIDEALKMGAGLIVAHPARPIKTHSSASRRPLQNGGCRRYSLIFSVPDVIMNMASKLDDRGYQRYSRKVRAP